MHVDVRKAGEGTIIVDLEGQLVGGTGDELLREVINELLGSRWKRILLNLTKLKRIDSAGIGELVASARLAGRVGSVIGLIHPQGRVREVLELSQVLPYLNAFDNEADALARLEAPASSDPAVSEAAPAT